MFRSGQKRNLFGIFPCVLGCEGRRENYFKLWRVCVQCWSQELWTERLSAVQNCPVVSDRDLDCVTISLDSSGSAEPLTWIWTDKIGEFEASFHEIWWTQSGAHIRRVRAPRAAASLWNSRRCPLIFNTTWRPPSVFWCFDVKGSVSLVVQKFEKFQKCSR